MATVMIIGREEGRRCNRESGAGDGVWHGGRGGRVERKDREQQGGEVDSGGKASREQEGNPSWGCWRKRGVVKKEQSPCDPEQRSTGPASEAVPARGSLSQGRAGHTGNGRWALPRLPVKLLLQCLQLPLLLLQQLLLGLGLFLGLLELVLEPLGGEEEGGKGRLSEEGQGLRSGVNQTRQTRQTPLGDPELWPWLQDSTEALEFLVLCQTWLPGESEATMSSCTAVGGYRS